MGYEDEQSALLQRHEGEPDDFHIEVPKQAPEVNPEVYRDVEPMLFKGFLHVAAEINEVPFVFKSLNHHEFSLLSLMGSTGSTAATRHKFYCRFLAYGVMMMDGINIMSDRDTCLPEVIKFFDQMGEKAFNKVIRNLSELNRKASRAVILSEAYALENTSRLRWAQLKGTDLTSSSVTGIEGTQFIGMNWAQLTWRAMNHFEDLREQAEREWENAKFVASAMAGKGMGRVHSQDKHRREKEREERIDRRDRILRFALLGKPMDKPGNAIPVKVARTVEELTHQLEQDLKGEKDWHDLVVEAHENKVRGEQQARAERLQELQKAFDDRYGGQSIIGKSSLEGLTPDEVKFQVERRRQLAAQNLSAQQVYPELMDPKQADFQDKWTQKTPPMVPVSTRPAGVPFRTNKK